MKNKAEIAAKINGTAFEIRDSFPHPNEDKYVE
jgi:hypothetical protein